MVAFVYPLSSSNIRYKNTTRIINIKVCFQKYNKKINFKNLVIQGPIFCCHVYSSLYSRSYPHILLGKCTTRCRWNSEHWLAGWLTCSQLPSALVVSTPPTLHCRSRLLRSKWIFSPPADGDGYWFSERFSHPEQIGCLKFLS